MELVEEIALVSEELGAELEGRALDNLRRLSSKLAKLAERKMVKSNHTIMELVIAAYLLKKGFEVDVEHWLSGDLVCDIYAVRGGRVLIVEVETGFVPPENSLDPIMYRAAREVSKVARYSQYADLFALATPPYHVLQLPQFLFYPPELRNPELVAKVKSLLDEYYTRPPVTLAEILTAKLHYIYLVLVDELSVIEYSAKEYYAEFLSSLRRSLEKKLEGTKLAPIYANSMAAAISLSGSGALDSVNDEVSGTGPVTSQLRSDTPQLPRESRKPPRPG